MDLISHVGAFLDGHGPTGVVAVSGGPDSVVLAHVISRLPAPPRIVLAHVNHRLRGVESDADEQFVRGLFGLPCRVLRVDTKAESEKRGENLEATARDLRYAWLAQVAREEGAGWIAV